MSKIEIQFVLNGWIVRVGCQTVVFTDKGLFLDELSKYLDDPESVEKRYLTESVNRHITTREGRGAEPSPDSYITPVGERDYPSP